MQGPSIGRGQMLNRVQKQIGVRSEPAPEPQPAKQEPWTLENHVPQGAVRKEDQPGPTGRGRGRGRARINQ